MNFFDDAVKYAKESLLEKKEFYPVFIANSVTGKKFIVVSPWKDDKEKQLIVQFVKLLFISESVDEYIFMTEMWFKKVDKMADRPKGFICDLPDKQEGFMVIHVKLENGKLNIQSQFLEIIRTNGFELKEIPEYANVAGTFTELLTLHKPNDNERELVKTLLAEFQRRYKFCPEKREFH